MALNFDTIVNNAIAFGDVSQAKAVEYANARHGRMVAEAGWRMKQANLSTTVAAQNSYAIPTDVTDFEYVEVGTTRYDPTPLSDIRDVEAGRDRFYRYNGTTGLAAVYGDSAGAWALYLYPAPSTTGTGIVAWQSLEPADIAFGGSDPTLIPVHIRFHLQDGVFAEVLKQSDERQDLEQSFEQSFEAGVEKLRRLKNSRQRPSGPARIRMVR